MAVGWQLCRVVCVVSVHDLCSECFREGVAMSVVGVAVIIVRVDVGWEDSGDGKVVEVGRG